MSLPAMATLAAPVPAIYLGTVTMLYIYAQWVNHAQFRANCAEGFVQYLIIYTAWMMVNYTYVGM